MDEQPVTADSNLPDLAIAFTSSDIKFVFKYWDYFKTKMGSASGVDYQAEFMPWVHEFEDYFNV